MTTEPPPPLRSSTLDALASAEWHMRHLRQTLDDELAYVYEQMDRLRADNARLQAERDTAVQVLKEAISGSRVAR